MEILTVIFSIILAIASGIYFYFKRSFSYFEKHGVPHVKPSFPLGNIQGVGSKYHISQLLLNSYNELKGKGPIAGFYNLTKNEYIVTDLELVKTITVKNFNSFVNRGEVCL
jgi:cytochrome P450 family 6